MQSCCYGGDGGLATNDYLYLPNDVWGDDEDSLFIADMYNHRIRHVQLSTNIISTYAGNGNSYCGYYYSSEWCGDGGDATSAYLSYPRGNIFHFFSYSDVLIVQEFGEIL